MDASLLLEILVPIASIVIGWIYRHKFVLRVRRLKAWASNKPLRVSAVYNQKYKSAPDRLLSAEIFERIRNNIMGNSLTKRSVSPNSMQLESKSLGLALLVWLEEEFEPSTIGTDKPEIEGYHVSVQFQHDERMGVRDLEAMHDFAILAAKIQDTIQNECFSFRGPYTKYVVCDITGYPALLPGRKEEFHKKVQAKVLTAGGKITIVCDEPSYLRQAIGIVIKAF